MVHNRSGTQIHKGNFCTSGEGRLIGYVALTLPLRYSGVIGGTDFNLRSRFTWWKEVMKIKDFKFVPLNVCDPRSWVLKYPYYLMV